jgi:hypothetical protein
MNIKTILIILATYSTLIFSTCNDAGQKPEQKSIGSEFIWQLSKIGKNNE